MIDTHRFQFTYGTDSNQPYWLEIAFHRSTVIVTLSTSDKADETFLEVIDKLNGNQLAYRNVNHIDMVKAWQDTVTKAHHLVLELHAEAVAQAERDRLFCIAVENFFEAFEAADKYSHNIRELRGVSNDQLIQMDRAAKSMRIVADALDLVEDPE